ncbi:MAG: ribonuclease PH [Candidatus Glassbacteria bacterium]|nr:ribonuclease PH [Candidatus Glassbacteria bacterium]
MSLETQAIEQLRPVAIEPGILVHPEGSCLFSMGRTRVICTATVEDKVPPFLLDTGRGWVTAEYGMLPRSTHTRQVRERTRGRPDSRALEISRLVGRCLRATMDLGSLGERTVTLDCDVLQADGGTRCCAINGAAVALCQALESLVGRGELKANPMHTLVAGLSVGLVRGEPVLDLDYEKDSQAEVDMNVVMTAGGGFVEIQGAAEKSPFDRGQLDLMLELARLGIGEIIRRQREALGL